MKVIAVDNFDRENISDYLVCENTNNFYAPKIAELLNRYVGGPDASRYYRAVEDDYQLYTFEP